MPYKIVRRGVVAQHPIEGRENQKKNNIKNQYWDDKTYAVDIFIVNVETRGGKMVRAPAFHQSGQGSTLYTTLYVVEYFGSPLCTERFSSLFASHQNPTLHFIHIDSTHAISRELEFGLITLRHK